MQGLFQILLLMCLYMAPQSTRIPRVPWGGGGVHTSSCEGVGSPNSDDWRKSLELCLLCEMAQY